MTTKNHLNTFEKLDSRTIEENSRIADELLLVEHLDEDNTKYLAGLLFTLGRYEESNKVLKKLLKMKGDDTVKTLLSIAMNHFYMKDYESSSEYLDDAFLFDPENETILSYMMLSYEFLGDIKSAAQSAEQLTAINPKNTVAINRLIEYHFQLENYEKCLHYIKQTRYKDNYKKALILYRIGRYEDCIKEAVKIKTAEAYYLAGKASLELDNPVKAVKYYYKSYQMDLNINRLFEISEIYFKAEDPQRAIHYLKEILIHDENNIDAIVKIAKAYFDSAKYHDAIIYSQKALEITKKIPDAYLILADAYYLIEGLEKSLNILDEGLDENPDSASLWVEKARTSYLIGMTDYHDSFKKARELKPYDSEILTIYINHLLMNGENELAKVYYNQLLLINPLFEKSYTELYDKWDF